MRSARPATTQDRRDVLFIGYAGGLVAGVWVGNDDNTPNPGLTSGIPARIWRDFMVQALDIAEPAPDEDEEAMPDEGDMDLDDMINALTPDDVDVDVSDQGISARLRNEDVQLRIGRDGVEMTGPGRPPAIERDQDPRDRRRDFERGDSER